MGPTFVEQTNYTLFLDWDDFLKVKKKKKTYLVALGLSCSIQDLLVIACEHLGHVGSSSLIGDGTQAWKHGQRSPQFLQSLLRA